MNLARRLLYPVIFAIAAMFIAATVQAQDVYNFYFQKAPGSLIGPAQPSVSVQGAAAAPLPTNGAVVPSSAPASAAIVTAQPAESKDGPFRHWSFQLMSAEVADANTDFSYGNVKTRFGLQVGYRFNKYLAIESGTSFGTMKGQWKAETTTGAISSFVPFLGLRLNALHLNFFGTEVLEFFATAGGMYIDQQGGDPSRSRAAGRSNEAELEPYVGGGIRICFSDRFGLEMAGRAVTGNPGYNYGMATTGFDLRF